MASVGTSHEAGPHFEVAFRRLRLQTHDLATFENQIVHIRRDAQMEARVALAAGRSQ
jgi:hypothetical protein